MHWLRALAPAAAAVVMLLGISIAGSCGHAPPLQLLRVLDIAPRDVELGDRVVILGEGFAPGKAARVTFRGTLHRAGERGQRNAVIETTGVVVGPQRVEISFDEALEAIFCRSGDRAAHTTFEGDVEVAFAASEFGAPPIGGALQGVTIDVRAPAGAADGARDAEGERLLNWIGLRVASDGRTGLLIEAVVPGSSAEKAGVVSGDVLASFDGVRVMSPGDAVPAAGDTEAWVGVRPSGSATEIGRAVSVAGFRRAPPERFAAATLIVLTALTAVLLLGTPTPGPVAVVLQRFVCRLRAHTASDAKDGAWGQHLGVFVRGARPPLHVGVPSAVAGLIACATFAVMPFGQYLVAARLDVGVLFVAAATALAAAAFVAADSPSRGALNALQVLWQHVPGALAVAGVVLSTGSLRVQEVVRAQGGSPWDWLAFRSPASLVAAWILFESVSVERSCSYRSTGLATRVDDLTAPQGAQGGPSFEAALRVHQFVIAGLVSALFLGGWSLPGLSPAQQDSRPALEVVGATVFLAKATALVFVSTSARRGLPPLTLWQRTRWTVECSLPISVGSLAGCAAWANWGPPPATQWLASGGLTLVALLVAVALGHRVVYGLTSPVVDARLNPFL
jgi:NADH-quinone oxidoreductase subunit H